MRMINNNSKKRDWPEKIFPWIGSLLFLPVVIYFILNGGSFNFLDYLNLLIHEGGHGIFGILGEWPGTAGGTLMQIIIPSLFAAYYSYHRNKPGFQFSMLWLGESLMNISVYAADARARQLPLLGGNKVYHDWTWMLSRLDLMAYDTLIGSIFFYAGVICFAVLLAAPLLIKKKEVYKNPVDLDL